MKCRYFPRIWPLPLFDKRLKKTKKGAVTLIAVFMYFLFSTVGLSLIFLSRISLKISAYKKNRLILEYTAENGIKRGFNDLAILVSSRDAPSFLTPEHYEELRKSCRSGGKAVVEEALGKIFPSEVREERNEQAWACSTELFWEGITEREYYFLGKYKAAFVSEGRLKNFIPKRKAILEASLKVLSGRIPLSYFPLLINKKLGNEQKEQFKEINNIAFLSSPENQVQPSTSIVAEKIIPDEASTLLGKALNIKIFHPWDLSRMELRGALGLEQINAPVPEGVYLINNGPGLGGIYVQGDVEEMILAIEEDFQVVFFRMEEGLWVLKFSLTKNRTIFLTPEETYSYDHIPQGVIAVNGKIRSLGGGIIDASGEAVRAGDEDVESVLQGVSLTIICAEKIILTAHLIHQGLRWQGGLPYMKDGKSHLIICSMGKDLLENEEKEGGIVVSGNAPPDMKIQAHLTAGGEGFTIAGEGKTVNLMGSLQTVDFKSGGNVLQIAFDTRLFDENFYPENSLPAATPLLHILSLTPLEWRDIS
ncbi:MAG: hypothetical protein WCC06_08400 [Candidatus Aminicenantales bacterium]